MLRFIRSLCLLLLLASFMGMGEARAWEYVERDGIRYVTMSSVRSAYGFTSQVKEGSSWVYESGSRGRTERVKLKMRSGSQDMYANGMKFVLSYPVVEDPIKGQLVSSMDINKIIHPILMPSFIGSAKLFNTIVIDPGHGGHDNGAVNRLNREKDLNLIVGKKLKALLTKKGFNVVMTRETDVYLTLQERVAVANKYQNAIFISVHFNFSRPSASGLETFTLTPAGTSSSMSKGIRKEPLAGNSNDSANIALATAVQGRMLFRAPQLIKTTLDDRGIKRARFSVLCTIKHPAILVECGFLSNPRDAELIRTDNYHNYVATAIADGVSAYKGALNRKDSVPAGAGASRAVAYR